MPDYSACMSFGCERRHECARYLMKFGMRQSVAGFNPDGCYAFWKKEEAPWKLVTPLVADARASRQEPEPTPELVDRAQAFAREKHGTRQRVGGELETEHLRRVAEIVADHGGSPEAIAAAWLHDVIEDCGVTPAELAKLFGNDVARTVVELTDDPSLVGLGGDWRHERQVALASVMSKNGALVKCADVLDNAQDMRVNKPDYFPVWGRKKLQILWRLRPEFCNDKLWIAATNAVRPAEDK